MVRSLRLLARAALPALAAALLGFACQDASRGDDVVTGTTGGEQGQSSRLAVQLAEQLSQRVQRSIRHSGVRTYSTTDWSGDTPQTTEFREAIHIEGGGRYAIEPLESIAGTRPSWAVFQLIQEIRQGLTYRYRDFAVRDADQFKEIWTVSSLSAAVTVAGQPCTQYRLERVSEDPWKFFVAVDMATGLVLRYREEDTLGRTIALLEYETVDYNPRFAGVIWYDQDVRQQLDVDANLGAQVDFAPFLPKVLPVCYELHQAEVAVADGERWLKREYTDGVNTLFFLEAYPELEAEPSSFTANDAARVMSVQIGAARALCGEVGGREVIVVGKVPEVELLDMLESALD